MIKSTVSSLLVVATICIYTAQARSMTSADLDQVDAVIPSPNQLYGDEQTIDLQRNSAVPAGNSKSNRPIDSQQAEPSNEASVPVYVSPFVRAERASVAPLAPSSSFETSQESSHAAPNYAPRPTAHSPSMSASDLKTSASYGHHGHYHGGHHGGYDHSGWLDMGAWTGGKGSFGWYADYPVGGKHYGYHGRK